MSVKIPAKLKAADLTRFIHRATQLETIKPVIAYWCEYWIVNNILEKGLHNGDPETLQFTTILMDKLEKIKADNLTNDAIVDDTAGQAYVEQFALETFQRAENTLRANRATRQTANTFQAAAIFLELVNIWSPPDAETTAKIKYAKWNAVRILRALNQGQDPNDSNPKPEPRPNYDLLALDPDDPEVKDLIQPQNALHATVEDFPEDCSTQNILRPVQSPVDSSANVIGVEFFPNNQCSEIITSDNLVSPAEPSSHSYFSDAEERQILSASKDSIKEQNPNFPVAPSIIQLNTGISQESSRAFENLSDEASPISNVMSRSENSNERPCSQYTKQKLSGTPSAYPQSPLAHSEPSDEYSSQNQIPSVNKALQVSDPRTNFQTDDLSMAKAQKHARWAISALNFEDTETAVRELREALRLLGAS